MRFVIATLLILMMASVALADKDLYRYCEPCIGVQGWLYPLDTWQIESGYYPGNDNMAFYFCAVGGQTYTFTFCQGGGTADYDTALSIQGPDGCGSYLACNDDSCSLLSEIIWVAPADGTYIVAVDGYSTGSGNFSLAYRGVACTTPTREESWSVIKSSY